jgi:hypothetical protein
MKQKIPTCAMCGEQRPPTREHIWPQGFLKRSDFGIRYSARANRTFKGDLVIKDVCAACNNGPMSRLDGYACEIYDRHFQNFPRKGEQVTFEYDYGRLTRWLLKTAFNSARSNQNPDVDLLRPYAPVILAEEPCSPAFVAFFVGLVAPTLMMNVETGKAKVIYPAAARSGPIVIPDTPGYDHVSTRMIMINAFFFTIMLSRRTTLDPSAVSRMIPRIPGQPLSLDGRMELTTSMDAARTLESVRNWPRM